MQWLHPDMFWTLTMVPLAVVLILFAAWRRRGIASRMGNPQMVKRLSAGLNLRRRRWKAALLICSIALLGLSLAGPRFGTQTKEVKREGIDLVVALDVSLSMMAEDVAPNRLERAKFAIKDLLDDLSGDRVGLVTFAGDAFVHSPLTSDYNAVRLFLDVADPSLIPTPGTDFGRAFEMIERAFDAPTGGTPADGPRTRAAIIVSDGEDHVGDITLIKEQARDAGIMLFAAGVGETAGAPIPVSQDGRSGGYKTDRAGNVVTTRLVEEALQNLSTDGAYIRISRTAASLDGLLSRINALETSSLASEQFEEYAEKFQWPLALGILILLVEWWIPERKSRI